MSRDLDSDGNVIKVLNSQSLQKYLYLLLPCLAMAFVTIHGPNLAMNLLSGGGSFNASAAAGGLMAMTRMPQTMSGFGFANKGQDLNEKKDNQPNQMYLSGYGSNAITSQQGPEYNNNLLAQNMVNKYKGKDN